MDIKEFETKLEGVKVSLEKHVEGLTATATGASEKAIAGIQGEIEETRKSLNSVQEQLKAINAMRVPGLAEELKKNPFSFTAAIKGMYGVARSSRDGVPVSEEKAFDDAGHELEILRNYRELRTKSNYAADGTAGGYLIPPEVSNEVIDLALAQMPIMGMGPTVIRGLVGELPIPKKTTRTQAYMVGENEKPTESGVTYGEATLRPKKCGAFTKQSNRLIYQSRGVSDTIIKQDISEALALKMESMLIAGTGSDKQPLGLLSQTNVNTFTSNGVDLTTNTRFRIDNASAMLMALDVANEYKPGGNYGFLMRPEVLWGMKRERVTQYSGQAMTAGAPVMSMNLLMNNKVLEDQLGVKLGTSTLLDMDSGATTSKVICGNWKYFYIGLWRDFVMKVSDVAGDGGTGSAFLEDQMYIVAFQEFDCSVMRGSAFTIASGAETKESSWV